jgi:hypothetical protein
MIANRRFELATLAAYAAILGLFLLKWHTPWRDELNSVLIARSAHSLADVIAKSRTEPHPPFWYIFIYLLPDTSLFTLRLVQWILSVSAAAVILFCSPFPRPVKAALIFGYFFLYAIGMYFRPYVVVLLIQSIWISFWDRRWHYLIPLSCLMALALQVLLLAHVLALMIGLPLLVEYWKADTKPVSRSRLLAALAIVAASSMLFFWQYSGNFHGIGNAVPDISLSVLNSITIYSVSIFGKMDEIFQIPTYIALFTFVYTIRKSFTILFSLLLCFIILGFGAYFYTPHMQHLSFYFMLAVTAIAMVSHAPWAVPSQDQRILWAVLLGFNLIAAVGAMKREVFRGRSNLEHVGQYLVAQGLDRVPVAATNEPLMSPILYFLPAGRDMYILGSDRTVTYFTPDIASLGLKRVDDRWVAIHESDILSEERVAKAAAMGDRVVLITGLFPVLPDNATSHPRFSELATVKERLSRHGFRLKAVFPVSYLEEDYAVFVKGAQ